jgi:hypothetical protein
VRSPGASTCGVEPSSPYQPQLLSTWRLEYSSQLRYRLEPSPSWTSRRMNRRASCSTRRGAQNSEWRLALYYYCCRICQCGTEGCTLILVSDCQRTTLAATPRAQTTAAHWFGWRIRVQHSPAQSCTLHSANLMISDDEQCERADRGHGPHDRKS